MTIAVAPEPSRFRRNCRTLKKLRQICRKSLRASPPGFCARNVPAGKALEKGSTCLAGVSGSQLALGRGTPLEPPASNRLGLAEPVSRTEGNKPLPASLLGDARQEYIAAARHGRGGRDVQARYSGRVDALVQQLAESARAHSSAAMSICALGGYGRRSLCLHSDIDLLILFEDGIGSSEERFVGALLQPLWDLGLTVGQHVRELADFAEPATLDLGNPEFLLALLDVRLIAGDERLFQRLDGWVRGLGADNATAPARCAAAARRRTARAVQRHALPARAGHQERARRPAGHRGDPAHPAPQARRDRHRARPRGASLDDAEDFFLRVRSVLHLESSRDVNVLTHELQERVAEMLGCEGRQSQQRVETLMGDYFRHARSSSRALERVRRAATPQGGMSVRATSAGTLKSPPTACASSTSTRAASRPSLWLELFRIALANGCAVSEQALTCIEQNIERYAADDFMATEGDRQLVRACSTRGRASTRGCPRCTIAGCSTVSFPEFARIHCRVIRDFYHKYTVDEHTLLAIRDLESLWNPANPSRALQLDPPGAARARAAHARAALSRRRQVARRRARAGERPARAKRCSTGWSCRPTRARRSSS